MQQIEHARYRRRIQKLLIARKQEKVAKLVSLYEHIKVGLVTRAVEPGFSPSCPILLFPVGAGFWHFSPYKVVSEVVSNVFIDISELVLDFFPGFLVDLLQNIAEQVKSGENFVEHKQALSLDDFFLEELKLLFTFAWGFLSFWWIFGDFLIVHAKRFIHEVFL